MPVNSLKEPYSWREEAIVVKEAIKDLVSTTLLRPFRVAFSPLLFLFPQISCDSPPLNVTNFCHQVDKSSEQKFIYIIKKTQEIAQKVGIQKPIPLFLSKDTQAGAENNYSMKVCEEFFSQLIFDEIDFVLAHEVSHIYYKHYHIRVALMTIVLASMIALAILFTPFTLFLTVPLGSLIEKKIHRFQEKQADLKALDILGTNKGALSVFNRKIQENLLLRNATKEDLMKALEAYPLDDTKPTLEELELKLRFFRAITTPLGNLRLDMNHPSLTERVAYCTKHIPQMQHANVNKNFSKPVVSYAAI